MFKINIIHQISKKIPTSLWVFFLFAIISLLIQSSEIFEKGFVLGYDSVFHMNRFYDTMMQIKTGNYSYFISLFGFQQSARVINAVYGPGMAYFMGFILLLAGSWIKFQLITSFLVNVIGAFGVYRIAKKCDLNIYLSFLIGCIYMTSTLTMSWNLNGSFNGIGNMVLPYVLYYGIEMMTNKKNKFSIVGLGLSMGILLQTHFFSSLLVTIALSPFIIITFISCKEKLIFVLNLFFSVSLSILSSLNVWLSLFHITKNNIIIQTAPRDLMRNAVFFSVNDTNAMADLGVVLTVLFLVQLFLVCFNWLMITKTNKILTFCGAIFLFISSRFFPWKFVTTLFPVLENFLQFPYRILTIPLILLPIAFGLSVKQFKSKNLLIILSILTVISVSSAQNKIIKRMDLWNSNSVLATNNKSRNEIEPDRLRAIINSSDLNKVLEVIQKGTSDYLPIKEKLTNDEFRSFAPYTQYWKYVVTPNENFNKTIIDGGLLVTWSSKKAEEINVPIIKYENTIVEYNGEVIHPKVSEIGTIQIKSQEGENILKIKYETPKFVAISIIIAIATIAILTLFILGRGICKVIYNLSRKTS
ncbi:hypothetical protein IV432_04080 [Enterococcus gallinarum]|uniref:hypothetical protein n=1 Tax=Enterococcus gallinarum TaxID=1353 RepID=UPI001E57F11B|nr:hypothetical protein [Enterococcus gallinarum]MCD5154268.1 hypothetical protein [Enterococcus gallinarum]